MQTIYSVHFATKSVEKPITICVDTIVLNDGNYVSCNFVWVNEQHHIKLY